MNQLDYDSYYFVNHFRTIPVPMPYWNISTSCERYNKPRRSYDNPVPKISFKVANLLNCHPCQQQQGQKPVGMPIHSHCWDIVERSIGHCRTSHKLERLVNVLYHRWTKELFFGSSNCVKNFISIKGNYKIFDPVIPNPSHWARITICHPEALTNLWNPIDSTVIHSLLADTIRESAKAKRHLILRNSRFYQQTRKIWYQIPLEIR